MLNVVGGLSVYALKPLTALIFESVENICKERNFNAEKKIIVGI